MTREVKSTELAAVWVESWLVPAESLDAKPRVDTPLEPAAGSAVGSATNATASPVRGASSASASFNLPLSYAIGSLWFGPELRYHQSVGRGFWLSPRLGLAYPITHRPEASARMLRASTALEYDAFRTSRFVLTPGIDVGASTLHYRNTEDGLYLAGPTLGAQLSASVAVSNSWWIVGRVETTALFADRLEVTHDRVYFSNHSNDSDPVDLVTTEERLRSTFIGAWILGIAWRMGDGT